MNSLYLQYNCSTTKWKILAGGFLGTKLALCVDGEADHLQGMMARGQCALPTLDSWPFPNTVSTNSACVPQLRVSCVHWLSYCSFVFLGDANSPRRRSVVSTLESPIPWLAWSPEFAHWITFVSPITQSSTQNKRAEILNGNEEA